MARVCDVCGKEDYYEEDGLYFCTECNTQSQGMIVVDMDSVPMSNQTGFGNLREVRQGKKGRLKVNEYVAGRPWTRYEAYQLVLQGQAKALIAHRAHSSIKDTIMRLYFGYLSKLEVAFVGEDKTRLIPKGLENSSHLSWHREFNRGGMEDPDVDPKAMKSKLKRQFCMSKEQKEKEHIAAALQREMFYEGDNPLEEEDEEEEEEEGLSFLSPLSSDSEFSGNSSEDQVDGCKVKHSTPKPKSYRIKRACVVETVQFMNVRKTLAFCYLGCLFSSPWITVSDILRWINDGSFPYLETSHLLNPDMKLSAYDHHLFRAAVKGMTPATIRFEAGRLLCFLGFEEIPKFPVKSIAIKYTLSLDLPESLVPCVVKLVRECPVDCEYRLKKGSEAKSLANVDALCAAYILVALKLTFGVDDHRERLLSKYTHQVQAKVEKGIELFDWCAWQAHATFKFLTSACLKNTAVQQVFDVTSVNSLCQLFERAGYKEQNFSHQKLYSRGKKSRVAGFKQENRELLKRSANILEERWNNREAIAARVKAEKFLPQDFSVRSNEEDIAKCFRNSCLDHIVRAEEFLRSHLGQGKSSVTSVCEGSQGMGSDDSVSASCSQGSCQSLFSQSTSVSLFSQSTLARDSAFSVTPDKRKRGQKRKRNKECDAKPERDCVKKRRTDGEVEEDISQLLKMHSQISEDYLTYPRQRVQDLHNAEKLKNLRLKQHQSYKWLLKVLSRLTFCPETDIELMVWEVEYLLREKIDAGS